MCDGDHNALRGVIAFSKAETSSPALRAGVGVGRLFTNQTVRAGHAHFQDSPLDGWL